MSVELRRARKEIESGRYEDAARRLLPTIRDAPRGGAELKECATLLAQCYRELGLDRAAATLQLYLGRVGEAEVLSARYPTDLARCAKFRRDHAAAARFFERAGWLGHAAMELEDAGDDRSARVVWEHLARDVRLNANPYVHGLVRYNLSRAADRLGDRPAARRAMIDSMHLIEAAADGFEAVGRRERAFDCYQVLMSLGREDGAYENLAEGYLNCIRILREDNLRYYALQFYEDFQHLSLERGELHAAATLFREAADYCRGQNLPYARHYRVRAAETSLASARHFMREEGAPELAENALIAAVDAFLEVGAYARARQVYRRLAELPLPSARTARYSRLEALLEGSVDDPIESGPLPAHLRSDTAYPEIWRLDVMEWEQGGDVAETMAEILTDPRWPERTCRLALLCRLHFLEAKERPPGAATLAELAEMLSQVEVYGVLAPLERLASHTDSVVRAAVMRASRRLFFKRTFVIVEAGLVDTEPSVRQEALGALRVLCFGHAFDPLARIFRQSPDREVRNTALQSIASIGTHEASELLLEALRAGDPQEREVAAIGLARTDDPEATPLLERTILDEPPESRARIERVLRQRRR